MTNKQAKFAAALVAGWTKGNFVARRETARFSGGALSGRTIANEEAKGNRVPGRIMVGRQVVYPVQAFAQWIAEKMLRDA